MEVRESEAKLQGRRFPKVWSSLRSLSRPCSGRTGPVPYFCTYGRKRCQILLGRVLSGEESIAYGTTYCAQEDRVCFFGRGEGFVCERGASGVDGGLE